MNKVNFFNLIPGAPKHIVKVRHGCTSILFNASGWMANPVLGDALCGAVAHFFKYLIPAYCEEFAANLRHWVGTAVSENALSTDNVLQPHERPDHGLRSLYGPLVFPESLVNILNVSVVQLKHVVEDADMMPTLAKFKGSVYIILYRLLLQHEDKPVQTRFWTFASCIGRLLLAKILHIPPEVFGTYFVQPREQNKKRLKLFRDFYCGTDTSAHLRVSVLCLRLTILATNFVSKQSGSKSTEIEDDLPVLVRLAQGHVQTKTFFASLQGTVFFFNLSFHLQDRDI